jgi:hypothetical protein
VSFASPAPAQSWRCGRIRSLLFSHQIYAPMVCPTLPHRTITSRIRCVPVFCNCFDRRNLPSASVPLSPSGWMCCGDTRFAAPWMLVICTTSSLENRKRKAWGQARRTRAEYVIEGLRAQLKLSPSVIFMIFDDIAGDPSNGFFDRPAVLTTAAFAHISRRSPATDISGTI